MKLNICYCILLTTSFFAHANNKICQPILGLSASIDTTQMIPYYNSINAVCLNGTDISDGIKINNGDKITGAFSLLNGDHEIFVVSFYNDDKSIGRIDILQSTGIKLKQVSIYSTENDKSYTYGYLDNIIINYFDENRGRLYFTEYTGGSSSQVSYLQWEYDLVFKKHNLHDGVLKGLYNGMPIISTIRHDSKGSYFPAYLINDDGIYCSVDTRPKFWTISPVCLQPGDDYKER